MDFSIKKPVAHQRGHIKQITRWIQERLNSIPHQFLGSDVQVMVSEIECNAPDCVPVETLAVLVGDKSKWVGKILKPLSEVILADIEELDFPSVKERSSDADLGSEIGAELRERLRGISEASTRLKTLEYLKDLLSDIMDETLDEVKPSSRKDSTNSSSSADHSQTDFALDTVISTPSIVSTPSLANPPITRVVMRPNNSMSGGSTSEERTRVKFENPLNSKPRHQKGVRPRGCPCCDPSNIDNIVDKLLFFDTPP